MRGPGLGDSARRFQLGAVIDLGGRALVGVTSLLGQIVGRCRNWYFGEVWRQVRMITGIRKEVWNRDMRAAGVTEGRQAGR